MESNAHPIAAAVIRALGNVLVVAFYLTVGLLLGMFNDLRQ